MKKKLSKIGIVVVFVVILVAIMYFTTMAKAPATMVTYTELKKEDLINSINTKGTVKSVDSHNVYGTQNNQILKVNVEVGDRVTQGQKLLEVDTEELSLNIAQKKSQLSSSDAVNLNKLSTDKRLYNEALNNYQSGTDTSIISAKSRVETTKNTLDNAQKDYDDKVKEYENSDDSSLISAENSIRDAEIDLENKKAELDKAKILLENGVISQKEYDDLEISYISAENKYSDALQGKGTTETSIEKEIDKLASALETAKINYNEALTSLESAELSASQAVDKYYDSVKASEISLDNSPDIIAIQILERQLEKTLITAPITGTVTAVYAKEGSTANGLLFVIEDTQNLEIDTKIKEYDYGKISLGMPVVIKSDSTGDDTYEGEIIKIAEASAKNANGEIASTNDVEFETKISVKSKETKLKIGMNAKLDIVLDRADDVFAVTYDALKVDDAGNNSIFIVEKNSTDNTMFAKEIPVEIGLEADFYIEIKSSDLKEGMQVISDAESVTDKMEIMTTDSLLEAQAPTSPSTSETDEVKEDE